MRAIYKLKERLTALGFAEGADFITNSVNGYADITWLSEDDMPTPAELLAVREEVNIITDLRDLVNILAPDCKAYFREDDYDATIWQDARPYPSLSVVKSPETILALAKQRAKASVEGTKLKKEAQSLHPEKIADLLVKIKSEPKVKKLRDDVIDNRKTAKTLQQRIDVSTSQDEIDQILSEY